MLGRVFLIFLFLFFKIKIERFVIDLQGFSAFGKEKERSLFLL